MKLQKALNLAVQFDRLLSTDRGTPACNQGLNATKRQRSCGLTDVLAQTSEMRVRQQCGKLRREYIFTLLGD